MCKRYKTNHNNHVNIHDTGCDNIISFYIMRGNQVGRVVASLTRFYSSDEI